MNTDVLRLIALKLRNKYPYSVVEQCANVPKTLTHEEQQYVVRQLKTTAYYKEKKKQQLAEREKTFFETFTIHNPFRSKNRRIANKKERELLRSVIHKHMSKERIRRLLRHYVIPCHWLSSYEMKLLTDSLLISCIDYRLRRYVKVKATKLGTNKFAYYLIKENWKRESPNHLVWKFELKRLFNLRIEQKIDEYYRIDLYKKHQNKTIIGEIVCKRQSIDAEFKAKIRILSKEENNLLFILAPTRIHHSLREFVKQNVFLVNAKTVISFLEKVLAEKKHADAD